MKDLFILNQEQARGEFFLHFSVPYNVNFCSQNFRNESRKGSTTSQISGSDGDSRPTTAGFDHFWVEKKK